MGKQGSKHRSQSKGKPKGNCCNCATNYATKKCPSYGKTCYNCNKKGHFKQCCRSVRHHSQSGATKDNPGMNSMRYQLPTMVAISKMIPVGSNMNKTQFMLCSVRTYILTLCLTFNSMKLMAKESSVYSQN